MSRRAASYARGDRAWGQCQRCGLRALRRDMVEDGHNKGLLVHRGCYEPRHPQEKIVPAKDPQALRKPAPDLDATDSRAIDNTLFEDLSDLGATFGAGSQHEG